MSEFERKGTHIGTITVMPEGSRLYVRQPEPVNEGEGKKVSYTYNDDGLLYECKRSVNRKAGFWEVIICRQDISTGHF